MAINYYLLLGVPPDADLQRIKAAYRSMAKRFHPDTNKGSEAAADLFRQINEAYQILADDQLRTRYDATLAPPAKGHQPAQGKTRKAKESLDPQKKFNRFLHSLLDAILTPDAPAPKIVAKRKKPAARPPKNRKGPDFNFFYSLALEKTTAHAYTQGDDGVIRRTPGRKQKRNPGLNTGSAFNVLLLVISGILSYLRY